MGLCDVGDRHFDNLIIGGAFIHMDTQSSSSTVRDHVLQPLEEAGLSGFHWRTWLTAGMGFFTDAYDLFIIGVVTSLLTPLWHLTTLDLMLLNSTALFAAVLGALIFGRLMDRLGRKTVYGIEAMLLTGGAILSAFAPNVWLLLVFRFIVGIGVGGDYPMSGIIMSEYSNRKRRGFLVNAVFAMQGFGLLVGPAVAAALLASGVPDATAWRLMLGLGAIPAGVVIWLRRSIAETPHFMLGARGDAAGAAQVVGTLTATTVAAATESVKPLANSARVLFTNRRFLLTLIGTAFSWMFLDMAFYGNSVSSSLIMKALSPTGSLLTHTLTSMVIFLVAAVPGYWISSLGSKIYPGHGLCGDGGGVWNLVAGARHCAADHGVFAGVWRELPLYRIRPEQYDVCVSLRGFSGDGAGLGIRHFRVGGEIRRRHCRVPVSGLARPVAAVGDDGTLSRHFGLGRGVDPVGPARVQRPYAAGGVAGSPLGGPSGRRDPRSGELIKRLASLIAAVAGGECG